MQYALPLPRVITDPMLQCNSTTQRKKEKTKDGLVSYDCSQLADNIQIISIAGRTKNLSSDNNDNEIASVPASKANSASSPSMGSAGLLANKLNNSMDGGCGSKEGHARGGSSAGLENGSIQAFISRGICAEGDEEQYSRVSRDAPEAAGPMQLNGDMLLTATNYLRCNPLPRSPYSPRVGQQRPIARRGTSRTADRNDMPVQAIRDSDTQQTRGLESAGWSWIPNGAILAAGGAAPGLLLAAIWQQVSFVSALCVPDMAVNGPNGQQRLSQSVEQALCELSGISVGAHLPSRHTAGRGRPVHPDC